MSLLHHPLRVSHVARLCGIPERTLRRYALQGIIPAFHDPERPKIWFFRRADIDRFKTWRAQKCGEPK